MATTTTTTLYSNYLTAGVRLSRARTRDRHNQPSLRSSSMDVSVSLPRSPMASLKTRQRSSDITSARTAVRSTDFTINGIERLKNRERLMSREDGNNCEDYRRVMTRNGFGPNKNQDQQISRETELSSKSFNVISIDLPLKETKKYAWREEIKDMEGKWQTLEEKSSNKMKEIYSDVSGDDLVFCKKPKYIEEYNKAVEDILEKVKVHDRMKDSHLSTPKKAFWKKEDFDIEDEIRKLKEKHSLRKSTIQDDLKAPTFSERYLQRQINKKTEVISQQQEVKKGAWRKDFARYEEDLEIRKLRKETEKKINSLDTDDSTPYEMTNSRVKKVDKHTENGEFKQKTAKTNHNSSSTIPQPKSFDNFDDSPTTFVKVKLTRQTKTEVDDSLTIQPAQVDLKNYQSVTQNENNGEKFNSHGDGGDYSKTKKLQDKSKDSDRVFALQDFKSKESEKKDVNIITESKEDSKRIKNITSEVKDCRNEMKVDKENVKEEEVRSNPMEEDEEDDADGMRAMRQETNNTLASLEAEFEAGRSKLAAVRARIRRAREMAKTTNED